MSNDNDIVITYAARTAVGSFNGALSSIHAHKMTEALIRDMLTRCAGNVTSTDISEVIIGHVLSGGVGQNSARQAAINAGLDETTTAWTLNKVCGSGLWSVIIGVRQIICGDSELIIAGGHESMSQAKHAIHLRSGIKMGAGTIEDMMIKDGLTDAFSGLHMGLTAENVAERFNISRQEQDELALASQIKAASAQKSGRFDDEIVPITITSKKGDTIFNKDEFVRHDATKESLSALKPAFKKDGTVTAGNASGINDGAAIVLIMKRAEAKRRGLPILCKIKSMATAGVAPNIMGIGPVPASTRALQLAGWSVNDLELIEANEAFAAQAVAVNKQMMWDTTKVNVNGGAIAIGHPIGASGARILVTLVHEMVKRSVKRGLATLCVGGGMGVSMCIEID